VEPGTLPRRRAAARPVAASLTAYPGLDILVTRERAYDRRRAALDAVVMERGMSLPLLRHLCAEAWA
jgi:hypothetical protein